MGRKAFWQSSQRWPNQIVLQKCLGKREVNKAGLFTAHEIQGCVTPSALPGHSVGCTWSPGSWRLRGQVSRATARSWVHRPHLVSPKHALYRLEQTPGERVPEAGGSSQPSSSPWEEVFPLSRNPQTCRAPACSRDKQGFADLPWEDLVPPSCLPAGANPISSETLEVDRCGGAWLWKEVCSS